MSAAIVATKNVNTQRSYLWILVAAISALTIKGTKEMKKRWTEAENKYLSENLGVLTHAEIAQHLGRTECALHLHITKANLSKRNWSEEEVEYLKEFWGNRSVPLIASHLGRTEGAVRLKASKLKLGRFLSSGDQYVTQSFLLNAIGHGTGIGYAKTSYIQNRGLPTHRIKVNTKYHDVVYLDEWWKWAEENKGFLDFSKFDKYALGPEPRWVDEKRKHDIKRNMRYIKTPWTQVEDNRLKRCLAEKKYTIRQLSDMLRRTEAAINKRISVLGINQRPVKSADHIRWTEDEKKILSDMIKRVDSYEVISDAIGRSAKAISGLVFNVYLTVKLDKVRAYIGDGEFGDGAPDKPLRHRRLMEKSERKDAEELLSALIGNLMEYAKSKSSVENQYKEFWQKDTCIHWDNVHGCTAGESDCDSCTSFRRIPVQYCKRCGKDFYEQKSNYFCNDCRRARLKQAQRKYAIMSNRKR